MRVFLDECIDWRLTRSFKDVEILTARQMGWSELKNGNLLREAAKQFDVFLTVDRGIAKQNNLPEVTIAVMVLRSRRSTLAELDLLVP